MSRHFRDSPLGRDHGLDPKTSIERGIETLSDGTATSTDEFAESFRLSFGVRPALRGIVGFRHDLGTAKDLRVDKIADCRNEMLARGRRHQPHVGESSGDVCRTVRAVIGHAGNS